MTNVSPRKPDRSPGGCAFVFLVAFVLCWTGIVATVDVSVGRALYRQLLATGFPRAEGTITRSVVETVPDSDGPSYRLGVAYTYEVNGRTYNGMRYCYMGGGNSSPRHWQEVSNALPVGARVVVAYNAAAPEESLLHPGLTGFHVTLVWFLTPFNLVMLAGWVVLAQGRHSAFGPNSFEVVPSGVRVRLPGLNRVGAFAGSLFGISFVGSLVWGCGCGFHSPLLLSGGGYLAAIACAACVAGRHVTPVLEVNQVERVLSIVTGRKPLAVPFDAVQGIRVAHEETPDSDAEGGKAHKYHCELLHPSAGGEVWVRIVTYNEPDSAERLVMWLRAEVGLPDQPVAR